MKRNDLRSDDYTRSLPAKNLEAPCRGGGQGLLLGTAHKVKRRFPVSFATVRRLARAAVTFADRHLTTTAMCVLLTCYDRRRKPKCRTHPTCRIHSEGEGICEIRKR